MQKLPKSAKELSRLLLEYSISLIKNGSLSGINGLADIAAEEAANGPKAPPLAKLIADIGGGKAILACHYSWEFRLQVQKYQVANNISAVLWETAEWKGELLRYPMICDQLQCLDQDIAICSKQKDKLVTKFLDFVGRWHLPLFREDAGVGRIPVTPQDIRAEAQKHQWAWLGHNSEFHPVYCSETHKILYYQAEFAIRFCSGNTSNPMKDGVWFQGREELTVNPTAGQ